MNRLARICIATLCVSVFASTAALAQIPRTISFQGVLADASGTFIPDGNHKLTLSIYDVATGGVALFSEQQTIPVIRGVFNAFIGSTDPNGLPQTLLFNKAYYLGVSIDGGTELSPRTAVATAPYAFRAQFAEQATHASQADNAAHATAADSATYLKGGVVTSVNGQQGAIQIKGTGNTTVTQSGNDITVSTPLSTGIQSINNFDGTMTIDPSTGPNVTIAMRAGGITQVQLADNSVIPSKIPNGSIAPVKMNVGGATTGMALIYNGGTSAIWGFPYAGGPAGGDLTGTYPNPTIAPLAGNSIMNALNNGATTNQLSYSRLNLLGSIVNADVSPSAAIAYSKLNLVNGITNNDVNSAAAIAYSKLNLTGGVKNSDVSPTAAIAYSKLALTNSIVTSDLTDGLLTLPKVNTTGAAAGQAITYNGATTVWGNPSPGGAAGGDLTGTYPNPTVANNAITSAKILDGTIVDADVSPTAAIAYSKLALTNSIQNGDIVANAITTSKVANGTITASKLADSAVSGLKLLTSAVNTAHIADGAVTSAKILDGTIQTVDIADGAITDAKVANGISYSKLSGAPTSLPPNGPAGGDLTGTYPNPTVANNAITSAKILDGTIVDADVSPTAAIAYSKLALTNSIQNGDIVANAITTSKVANGTITTSKLADSAVSGLKLLTGAVNTAHIADGAVTDAKVANGISYSKLSGAPTSLPPNGPAGGDLTGTYPNPTVANNAITSAKILDGSIVDADVSPTAAIAYSKLALTNSIQNGDIVANAITTSKVANGTITTSKLADSAVSGLKLLTGAVNTAHIADGAVTDAKVANGISYSKLSGAPTSLPPSGAAGGDLTGTYPNPTVANNAITSAKILDGSIVDADVSPTAAIAYSKLALTNSIQNGDIVANAITTSKVANGTITTSKLADSAVSGLKLLTNAVTSAHIADGTIIDADVSPTAGIVYSKLTLTNSIQNSDLVANSVTTSKVANGTVTTSKLADSAVSGLKLLTGAVNTAHIANDAVTSAKILDGTIQGVDIAAGTFTTINAHHALGNNDNVARELRLLEPSGSGVNYTAFKAQAQAGDITYTLPNTAPTAANQVLQVQAVAGNNASLSWGAIGGGSIAFSRTGVIANAGNTSYNVVTADDIIGIDMSAGTNFTVNLQPATNAGEILIIKIEKYNNALLPVLTIQPNGTDKIEGANNLAFGNAGGVRRLYSDGAGNWYTW